MHVWILNHYAESSAGVALRTFELSRELVRRGYAVTVFASSFSHYRLREEHLHQWWRLWKSEDVAGVRFVWLRGNRYSANNWRRVCNMLLYGILAFFRGLLLRPSPRVIIGCSVHPCAALVGVVLARLLGARFVVEVPDLWPQVLVDFGKLSPNGLVARVLYRIERFLYIEADSIIMLWRNTQGYLQSRGLSVEKVVWIPHVVDASAHPPDPSRPADGRFVVMFLGSFVQSMVLDIVLDAARLLQDQGRHDIHFVLIGEGVEKRRIVQRAEQLGLSNLEIRPGIPKAQVPTTLREADCFLCTFKNSPVYKYGVSMNKVCDYLMAGRPVVFCGGSAYDPVAESGAGQTTPGEDPAALAGAVEALRRTPAREREEMSRRGRDFVLQHHGLGVLTDRLEAIIVRAGMKKGNNA